MSAQPSESMDIERITKNYIDGALRLYDNGSFILFNYGCRTYAGVSQPLAVVDDSVLVRVIKIQQPVPDIWIESLKRRCRDTVLEVDESVDVNNRQLFYARLHDGVLNSLNPDERRHLVTKGLF